MIQVLREVLIQKIMRQKVSCESLENDIAYADEPLADEEWIRK